MSKKNKTILVADDNPIMQKVTTKFLNNNNFTVYSAYSAEECCVMAHDKQPQIILMDVILPDGNGKDVVKKLKEDEVTKNIPIIFTTNTLNLNKDDGNQTFEVDGQRYRAFAKPLHYRKLMSTIHKEMNRNLHGGQLPPEK